ncbi:MAG: helix-turn-helix transcriptional regulator [Hungatella sp.]|nr:helix-turn-helix transcriptional regulator [Hungatella sp.]
MTINTQIDLLIKKLDIKKVDFAKKLKIDQSYVTRLIKGDNLPSERLIDDICREFNVNKTWLLTGEGGPNNMFISEDMQYFQNAGKLAQEKNEFKKFYLNMMMGLPDEYWDYIYKEFKKFEEQKEE